MRKKLAPFLYSFPVRLLILHLRRHLFMLVPFLLFILIATKNFGAGFGIHSLFLDPEYLGHVNAISFFFIGFAFGGFVLTWQITSYILHSFRFPFLATFEKPFLRYILNNAILPLAFIIIYFCSLFSFQTFSEEKTWYISFLYMLSFLVGFTIMMLIAFAKYFNSHQSETILKDELKSRRGSIKTRWRFDDKPKRGRHIRVDSVMMHPFKIRLVRDVSHYKEEVLQNVFKKHHINALKFLLIAILFLLLLGLGMDHPAFRIPAGASIILLFTILIAPVGALSYWLKEWAMPAFITMILLLNVLIKFDWMNHHNKAFGLSYNKEIRYNLPNIQSASSKQIVMKDKQHTLEILEAWKKKLNPDNDSLHKPKMIFINASGGGLRATVWSFHCIRLLDSLTNGRFFSQVELISGASGGMMGSAYYRELYNQRVLDKKTDPHDKQFIDNASKDLLNAVCFSIVVNDLFFPWQSFRLGENIYWKDRGYLFEKQWNENTGFILDKTMQDYVKYENEAQIPMMFLSPVIVDDGRRFTISSQPVAYMNMPPDALYMENNYQADGIDLMNFFREQNAGQLKLNSALRMNSTFPFIMPNVYLPTAPEIEVMDAGLRDDYGMETTARFIETFHEWINENTSGTIVLQLRSFSKHVEPSVKKNESLFSKLLSPINTIYTKWSDFENYQQDEQLSLLQHALNIPCEVISLEYQPSAEHKSAGMSWHLTAGEKKSVLAATETRHNQKEIERLLKLLNSD